MVKTGHVPTIRQLTYQPPREATAPVETMSFARLRQLDRGATQRGDFHVLAFIRRGHGEITVDFSAYAIGPLTVVWIRPGVVHRWNDLGDVRGDLVLFVPTATVTERARAIVTDLDAAVCWTVDARTGRLAEAALAHLRLEAGAPEIVTLLLSALILRLDPPSAVASSGNDTFSRFRLAVEEDFRSHHDVAHYAAKLAYSPKTLSRSALAATGRTAKDYLTDRLILEAKRLLAHDRLTPARVAERLGFRDASNFSAFFVRETGSRPGAWREASSVG